jgi:Fe-S-cluster containining protein
MTDPIRKAVSDEARNQFRQLAAEADRLFARVARENPGLVKCRPGCDDCCRAVFLVSAVEGSVIAGAVRELPRRERRLIERQAQKAAVSYDALVGRVAGRIEAEEWSRQRIDCPLLIEGRCALYEHRPITCRVYGVPTAIGGRGRTCPRSGFLPGRTYPTINLDGFEARLDRISEPLIALAQDRPLPRRASLAWYLGPDGPSD